MELKVIIVLVERHHLLLWHHIHPMIQHTLHVFHTFGSILGLVNTVK